MAPASKPAIVTGIVAALALAGSLVTGFEGTRYRAYADGVGVWTICQGHTRGVKPGDTATKAQCAEYLKQDLAEAAGIVSRCVPGDMPVSVRAALISLTYNVGKRPLCDWYVGEVARTGNWRGTCEAIERYASAGGRKVKGLVRRRAEEKAVCLRDVK